MKKVYRLSELQLQSIIKKVIKEHEVQTITIDETEDLPMEQGNENAQLVSDTLDALDSQKILNKQQFCNTPNVSSEQTEAKMMKLLSSKLPPEQANDFMGKTKAFISQSNPETLGGTIKTLKSLLSRPKEAVEYITKLIGFRQPQQNGAVNEQLEAVIMSSFPLMVLVGFTGFFLFLCLITYIGRLFSDKKNYCGGRF